MKKISKKRLIISTFIILVLSVQNVYAASSTCASILGPDMTLVLKNILRTIQLAAPALIIILTSLEYIKAVSSGNQDDVKKTTQNLAKRLIAAALLFLLPTIINFIFGFIGITSPTSCLNTTD